MPNCFQLRSKETGNSCHFIDIDLEICDHLGVPVDDDKYYAGWYDIIGFRLAMGQSFDDIRLYMIESPYHEWSLTMLKIVNFLDTYYTPDSWVEIGRQA